MSPFAKRNISKQKNEEFKNFLFKSIHFEAIQNSQFLIISSFFFQYFNRSISNRKILTMHIRIIKNRRCHFSQKYIKIEERRIEEFPFQIHSFRHTRRRKLSIPNYLYPSSNIPIDLFMPVNAKPLINFRLSTPPNTEIELLFRVVRKEGVVSIRAGI